MGSPEGSILLLGGAKHQVVAIEKAHKLGYRTVLCDYLPDNPGQQYADSFHLVSTTDRDAVLEVARREGIGGIISYASDPAAPTAAYVAEQMGLPTNPLKSVEVLSSKNLFRKHLQKAGIPQPRAVSIMAGTSADDLLKSIANAHLHWPVMVKPTDSSGSKGVTLVHESYELEDALSWASGPSRNGVLIAEEYIERGYPYIIGGDIFVFDGKVVFWGLMDCLRDERAPLIPIGKLLPSLLDEVRLNVVKQVIQDVISSLDIRFGEMNVEVMVGEDDNPYVIEIGARAGGNMIPVQLMDASGIDLVAANVLCAMGERPEGITWEPSHNCDAQMTYVLHTFEHGHLVRVEFSEEVRDAVYRIESYCEPGDEVLPFDGADKALGIAFLSFDSQDAMRKFAGSYASLVRIEVA